MTTRDSTALRLAPAEAPPYRTAPHNIEAEVALLGAILVNNEAFYRVSDFLDPDHFHDGVNARVYEVARDLIRAGKIANPITIKTYLGDEEALGEITVGQYLARLAAEATTIINAEHYGHLIHDLAVRRRLIAIGEGMVNTAYDAPVQATPREQIEEAERALFQLAETGRFDNGFRSFPEALKAAVDMANAAFHRDGGLSGLATGLRDLDEKMGGLQPSDLIILAGRPAMGKTSLATNIAYNIARAWRERKRGDGTSETTDGGVVGFFSLEMSAEQLATRILSEQAMVSSELIRRGKIQPDEFDRLVQAAQEMQSAPLFIDQTGGISVAQLVARARRLKRQKGLDLIVVDYLQLLSGSSRRASENRVQEITEITTGLKALAKELNVPVLALSQLSRQVENRDDKRPQLADLRESGSIEQDADVVLFVFREEYYHERKKPKEGTMEFEEWAREAHEIHGVAEVIIAKQRHGPTGIVRMQFEKEFTRFSDLALDHQGLERGEM